MADLKLFEYQQKQVRTLFISGQVWFVARDVCDILDIGSTSQAVNGRSDRPDSGLDEDEKGVATVTTPQGPQEMLIVNESGLYALVWNSRKPEAKTFKRWVRREVLPQIRKTGVYVQPQRVLPLSAHTNENVQKTMSKGINAANYEKGGKEGAVDYNVKSMVAFTGKTPSQWIREAKQEGMKSKDRTSGKQVVRTKRPAIASCMSLADNLCQQGYEQDKVIEVAGKAKDYFEAAIELGIEPPELKQ